MKTELGFLLDLFLNEETPQKLKPIIADRIKEVELSLQVPMANIHPMPRPPSKFEQQPSMQRIIDGQQNEISTLRIDPTCPPAPPLPVTAAAAEALHRRAELLKRATTEKPEPGRTAPRKV